MTICKRIEKLMRDFSFGKELTVLEVRTLLDGILITLSKEYGGLGIDKIKKDLWCFIMQADLAIFCWIHIHMTPFDWLFPGSANTKVLKPSDSLFRNCVAWHMSTLSWLPMHHYVRCCLDFMRYLNIRRWRSWKLRMNLWVSGLVLISKDPSFSVWKSGMGLAISPLEYP